jgi:hypothetical protein
MVDDWQEALGQLGGVGLQKMAEVGFLPFLVMMTVSLLCSLFISHLYVRFYGSRGTGSQVHRAFPLLGVSITAIFIAIQFSLPLSLGLLGALSIVRFRTPIKEPEEIGFILLVVATSLTCATFNLKFLVIVLGVGVVALLVLRYGRAFLTGSVSDGMLVVSIPTAEYRARAAELLDFLEGGLPNGRIDSVTENDDETVLSYRFSGLDKRLLLELPAGIVRIAAGARPNLYFDTTTTS